MDAGEYFADDYAAARDSFLSACRVARVKPVAHWPPGGGETGLPLVETVRLGHAKASRILVICGGDREMDALCCSAIESGWLVEFAGAKLPRDTAMFLLHHGPAPQTGGEEPEPERPPPKWENVLLATVEERYAEYARQKGVDSLGAPLDRPVGPNVPGYPKSVLDSVADMVEPARRRRIALVDIRVGLGPYGEAEITPCHPPGGPAARRVDTWFSRPPGPEGEDSGGQEPDSLAAGLMRRFAGTEVTALSAAFGTYSMMSVLDSLATRSEDRAAPDPHPLLFPQDKGWRTAVWQSAIVVIQRALTALHAR